MTKELKMTPQAWAILTIARAQRRARATLRLYGRPLEEATVNELARKPRSKRQPLAVLAALGTFAAAWTAADAMLAPADADYFLDGRARACYIQDDLRYVPSAKLSDWQRWEEAPLP